ncbi:MAG: helix-turn-helix domain-containing protein [Oscillospiraceae bacterium]|nr:helix-turn-helix domain-containing protein [Oscillospiraceae bacterium]MBQ6122989.1 helix-turn-helix domain-containing protein [Clostridia bacterium]
MEKLNLLTKAEVAEILSVSEDTVERMIRAGQLPAYRIARACTRIDARDVEEYLAARRVKVAALRQTRIVGPKDLRRQRAIRDLPCPYKPGDKVV